MFCKQDTKSIALELLFQPTLESVVTGVINIFEFSKGNQIKIVQIKVII